MKKSTCFKNLIMANKPATFPNVKTYKTGLSDFHIFFVSLIKVSYKKKPPSMIKYKGFKKLSNKHFKNFLNENLASASDNKKTLPRQFEYREYYK